MGCGVAMPVSTAVMSRLLTPPWQGVVRSVRSSDRTSGPRRTGHALPGLSRRPAVARMQARNARDRGRADLPVGPVLRLFRFRSAMPGFDATIRDVLIPDVVRIPGNLAAYAGRIGPDDDGTRLIATVWASHDAMVAG